MDHSVAAYDDEACCAALDSFAGQILALLNIAADQLADGQAGAAQPRCRGLAGSRAAATP